MAMGGWLRVFSIHDRGRLEEHARRQVQRMARTYKVHNLQVHTLPLAVEADPPI